MLNGENEICFNESNIKDEILNEILNNKKHQQVNWIIWSIWIEKKIIACIKDEGSMLNAMTTTLKLIVTCEILTLDESFQGICFGLFFSKAC